MTATKPTPEQISLLNRLEHLQMRLSDGERAALRSLLDAYEATLASSSPAPTGSLRAVAEEVISTRRARAALMGDEYAAQVDADDARREREAAATAPPSSSSAVAQARAALDLSCKRVEVGLNALEAGALQDWVPVLAAEVIRLEGEVERLERDRDEWMANAECACITPAEDCDCSGCLAARDRSEEDSPDGR